MKIIKYIFISLGLILSIYSFILLFIMPRNIASYLPLILGIAFIVYGLFFKSLHNLKGFKKILTVIIDTGLILFILSFLLLVLKINTAKKESLDDKRDFIIVLGSGLKGDKVSKTLKLRLDRASEIYSENKHLSIVVSGGQGPDELISEAEAMENYLLEKGLPKSKIIKEDKSTSTLENFKFSKDILDRKMNDYKVIHVTNDYHSYRAGLIAKKLGMDTIGQASKTPLYFYPSYYLREYLSILNFIFLQK